MDNFNQLKDTGNRFLLRSEKPKYPVSNLLSAKIQGPTGVAPIWMDNDGVIWGANNNTNYICKSGDYGETYTDVLDVGIGIENSIVMATNSGKIITIKAYSGDILLSNEAKTSWTTKGSFSFNAVGGSGGGKAYFSSCKRGDVILFGQYGSENADNPKTQIWASFDDGETFNQIFNHTFNSNQGDEGLAHVHDVEWDSYTSTIWAASGDTGAKNIWYSHDFGATWLDFYGDRPQSQRLYQPTQIWAFPHGIIFGTDERPDGLRYLPRKHDVLQPNYRFSDLIPNWMRLDDSETMTHIFYRRWFSKLDGEPLYMIPIGGLTGGFSRIIASRDGIFWSELFRFQPGSGPIHTIIGPDPNDPEKRVIGSLDTPEGKKTFIAKMPDWV